MSDTPRRRSGGRSARQSIRKNAAQETSSYLTRSISPMEVVSDEGLSTIEYNADTILEEIGMDFSDYPSALDLFKNAGAQIDGERVRFPRGLCREIVTSSAPSTYTHHAKNPNRSVEIGGNSMVFVPAYGSPFVRDLDHGRRYATIEDFNNFVKLAYMNPHMHLSGGTVCEPVDVPVAHRHLDMIYAHLRYSDKPFMGSVTAAERAQDSIDMAKLVFGAQFVEENTVMTSLINANSPMAWDATMLGAAETYAKSMQATMISPFILAGAMAPVTVAGVASQTLAEALAGMTFVQLVKPGAPVIFGSFASSMSMQTGAPTFGTPEPALVLYTVASLARRLGVPFRSGGNLCASKIPDAQAALESLNTLWPTVLGGVNFVLHAAGWLEGGLVASFEKLIIDVEMLQNLISMLSPIQTSEEELGIDAIKAVAPGGHFFGTEHTMARYETAFYTPLVSDWQNNENWEAAGGKDATERATSLWQQAIETFEAPLIDGDRREAIDEYVDRRKTQIGSSEP